MRKEKYYICLGCFNVYTNKHICCEKGINEPFDMEEITWQEYRDQKRLLKGDFDTYIESCNQLEGINL